jgi:drug/metabolite transporter (DMT)-like permease
LRSFVLDQSEYSVIEPGARVKNRLLRGSRKGEGTGEFWRFLAQFKSFSFAYLDSVLGREIYGRGYDTLGEYLARGKGDMLGFVRLAVAMSLFGYAGSTVKGLLKGREPQDPRDPRTWLAAFLQGGSAGIFGDFLFGNFSRQGKTLTATLAGPMFGLP